MKSKDKTIEMWLPPAVAKAFGKKKGIVHLAGVSENGRFNEKTIWYVDGVKCIWGSPKKKKKTRG